MMPQNRHRREHRFALLLFVLGCILVEAAAKGSNSAAGDEFSTDDDESEMNQARQAAKPWYASDTQVFGYTIPVSPISILTFFLALWNLIRGVTKASRAEGSHILIRDHTDATKKLLGDFKRDIGDDGDKFAKYAREYSACPSKKDGGYLGKWKKGDMAPPCKLLQCYKKVNFFILICLFVFLFIFLVSFGLFIFLS